MRFSAKAFGVCYTGATIAEVQAQVEPRLTRPTIYFIVREDGWTVTCCFNPEVWSAPYARYMAGELTRDEYIELEYGLPN